MMTKPTDSPGRPARGDPWEFASYALRSNRVELIRRFNQLAGRPSYTVAVLQVEFIEDKMVPEEMMAFVKEYSMILAAAKRADLAPDEPS